MWKLVLALAVPALACGPPGHGGGGGDDDDMPPGQVCTPGSATCMGSTSHYCNATGTGWVDEGCDPEQNVMCNVGTGLCEGPCTPHSLAKSYIGCEYYPTVTANPVVTAFHFAVAISNTSSMVAQVTIDGGGLASPLMLQVGSGDVAVQTLPWVESLKLCTSAVAEDCMTLQSKAAFAVKGAYHLRSTVPVTVYQFSPLEYTDGTNFSYTNDASLLLPVNAWAGDFMVAAWPRMDLFPPNTMPGFIAITAGHDNTNVTLTATANTDPGWGAPPFAKGVPQTVNLYAGDVLEVAAVGTNGSSEKDDLTGSQIVADKPVQVVAGTYCSFVPDATTGYCDHLEESIFPTETLSTTYVVSSPAIPPIPNGKQEVVRVVATTSGTTLTYDPPQAGARTSLNGPGDYVELARNDQDFVITSDDKILVMQYMEGQDAGGDTGDPAMTQAVPIDQYRTDYLFHAPANYEVNYVNVTAPTGAHVMLDGVEVTGFAPIGASGYGVARVNLPNGANGNHSITGDQKFGISVYGYGQYTSYWYPGGLDLAPIPIP